MFRNMEMFKFPTIFIVSKRIQFHHDFSNQLTLKLYKNVPYNVGYVMIFLSSCISFIKANKLTFNYLEIQNFLNRA